MFNNGCVYISQRYVHKWFFNTWFEFSWQITANVNLMPETSVPTQDTEN
jgi:hypothetical protein